MKLLKNMREEILQRIYTGVALFSAGGTTWFNYWEQYSGAITFLILFLVSLAVKIFTAYQQYRHREERHEIEMQMLLDAAAAARGQNTNTNHETK